MIYSFKLCICRDPRIAREYTAQNTKICAPLACLAQPTYPMPARCGTDTAGRGAFEPPSEDGARTKLFDREFQFRELHTEAETEKTPDRIPLKKNDNIDYTFTFCTLLLSSFWTGRGHRCRPFSPPTLAFNFYRAKGSAISLLVDCSSSVANSRSRAFRKSICAQEKVPTNLHEDALGGARTHETDPIPGSRIT